MAKPTPNTFLLNGGMQAEPAAVIISKGHAKDPTFKDTLKQARSAGLSIELFVTESAEDCARVLDGLSGSDTKTVIAAGGDGAVNTVAAELVHRRDSGLSLGVLAMGTGNDFAGSCRLPADDLALALRVALASPVTEIDVCYANDKPFINAATMGNPAEVSAEIDDDMKKRFGRLAYACFGAMKIGNASSIEAQVKAGDWSWSGLCMGVMAANGRETGGGFEFAPQALLNDGQMDGLIVPEMPIHEWMLLAIDMRAGRIDPESDNVPTWRSRCAELAFAQPVCINLDGEPMRAEHVSLRVEAKALRVRLPVDSPVR